MQTLFSEKPHAHTVTFSVHRWQNSEAHTQTQTQTHTDTHTHMGRGMKHGSREQKQSPCNMSLAAGICWQTHRLTVCICACVFPLCVYVFRATPRFAPCRCSADSVVCAYALCVYILCREGKVFDVEGDGFRAPAHIWQHIEKTHPQTIRHNRQRCSANTQGWS